jgi:tetratricopeptide (TPR) repeat protein
LELNQEADLLNRGRNYFERHEYTKATRIFSELLEINVDSGEAYFYLGNIFHQQGELGKAIKAFNRVLEIDPNHTDASICLSVLYNDIGHYESGKRVFSEANDRIMRTPTSPEAGVLDSHINQKFANKHFELAELYMTYNRFDEALFEYNKACGLDPENLEIRVKVAKVYAKKGFFSKAFDELRKVKNEYPNYLAARVALGILHFGNDDIIEAQEEWRKVLTIDPAHSDAKMYLNLAQSAASETRLTIQN